MQINQLPSTSTVNSTDLLVKEQANGTTEKIAISDFVVNNPTLGSKKPVSGGGVYDELITQMTSNRIPANADLNSYTTPGVYIVESDAIAATITNIPRAASGKLIVILRQSANYITQIYIPSSTKQFMYSRNYNNGTFSAWASRLPIIVHTGTATTGGTGNASFEETYNSDEYMCLSVVASGAYTGYMLIPYKYGDAANGRWGFKAITSAGTFTPIANTQISYTAILVQYA